MHTPARNRQVIAGTGSSVAFLVSGTDSALLLALSCVYTPNAEAASRLVKLEFKDQNGLAYYTAPAATLATASLAATLCWARGAPTVSTTVSATSFTAVADLPELWISAGDEVVLSAQNFKAGDLFSAVTARYLTREHWRELQREAQIEAALSS